MLAFALLAAACGGGGAKKGCRTGAPACIGKLRSGAAELSMIAAQENLPTGRSVFTFGLTTQQGGLLTGGSPLVYIARDDQSAPLTPVRATFYRFTPDPEDRSPRSPLTGFYAAEVAVPTPGRWLFAAVASSGSGRAVGTTAVEVTSGGGPAAVGSKAVSVKTPVATTPAKLREICTRPPPDPMHYISLDRALRNGKPTVVVFSTPLLCESQLCGPVTDEALRVFRKVGPDRANFIHVEEFLPGKDLKPPPPTLQNQSPGFKAWGFRTEPWTVVIDRNGIIRASFEGPVVAQLIEAGLRPLL